MSKHRTETIRTTEQLIADRIRDRIHELTAPHTTEVSQWVVSDDGTRMVPKVTRIEHPSLLHQLRADVSRSTAGAASRGPSSRPPTNLETIAVIELVQRESRHWLWSVDRARVERPDMVVVVGRLWRLADLASTLEWDDLVELDRSVRTWWVRARVATTWGDPPLRPHVPCSECSTVGGIRVTLVPTTAACIECGATWDGSTIGALGDHVRMLLETPVDAVVDALRRGESAAVGLPVDRDTLPVSLRGVVTIV